MYMMSSLLIFFFFLKFTKFHFLCLSIYCPESYSSLQPLANIAPCTKLWTASQQLEQDNHQKTRISILHSYDLLIKGEKKHSGIKI